MTHDLLTSADVSDMRVLYGPDARTALANECVDDL